MALFRYNSQTNKLVPITGEGNIGLPVGAVQGFALGTQSPNWLLCDGRDTTGTDEELRTKYPALYTYLGGTNILPDYRECVLVGVGENTTDTIAEHDVYTLGEFKDDQFQAHTHSNGAVEWVDNTNGGAYRTIPGVRPTGGANGRTGTTTHGKQKGVAFYIKATSAGIEVDKDLYATKGYIRDQNILSDYETITLPTSSATAMTMEYDGILSTTFNNTAGGGAFRFYVSVNGIAFWGGSGGSGNTGDTVTVTVKKGDTVYYFSDGQSIYASYAAFYKLRDYTGR